MKLKSQTNKVIFLGNYFGVNKGASYDGAVFDLNCLCNTLLASNAHGNVPKFIIIEEEDEHTL